MINSFKPIRKYKSLAKWVGDMQEAFTKNTQMDYKDMERD